MNPINDALSRVHAAATKKGSHVLYTKEISRPDRELLVQHRWLEEIIQGWYLLQRPDLRQGDSTAWYASFWDFLKAYLEHHYNDEYCLSAECSIDLHLGSTHIPKQIIVMAPKGGGAAIQLPHDTSLLVYKDPARLPEEREKRLGLQVMPLTVALCKVSPTYFQTSPRDAEIALRLLSDPSDLLRTIVEHHFKSAADRLIGAFRFLGNNSMADTLKRGLQDIGVNVQEKNPFQQEAPITSITTWKSPYAARIQTMWQQFRKEVIALFPHVPTVHRSVKEYLHELEEIYSQDAYNSLSIEGYHVTKELIEKVKDAKWNPDGDPEDRHQRDVLAARGYYEAFLVVKESIEKILQTNQAAKVVKEDLPRWYQKLFQPSVEAGILSTADLFGYRRNQVYIRNSRHVPPAKEYVMDAMTALFDCLEQEEDARCRAVLGHFFFVYIHPYMDGNGRIGRFLMNAMLASGNYPWTVIQVTHRTRYFEALEAASYKGDIRPFTKFLISEQRQTG